MPEESVIEKQPRQIWLLAIAWTLLFLLIFLLLSGLGVGIWGWSKWSAFTQSSGLSFGEVRSIIQEGWQKEPLATNNHKNILLLGTDSLAGRGDAPVLTDTMMLVSLDLESGKVTTLGLPRDLYSSEYQTRINALYVYGEDRYPDRPETFPEEVVAEMTGLEINHTLVLGMDQVAELIDLVGGVEVDVPIGFVDEEFPRPDVDVTVETDPAILYKTVVFEPGKQVLSGERALEYMRSRKSGDDEGTDTARSHRQQLVIEALVSRLKQREVILDTALMGQIYKFYEDNFSQVISPQELVAVAKSLYKVRDQVKFVNQSLSIYPDDEQGVIEHPDPRLYQNQWLYVIRDKELFRQEIESLL
jgi:anionic cell wall polymer biosynthesis LytR-Cps2A-Psr (LCP) family protein